MSTSVPLPEETIERIDQHRDKGQSRAEFIEELLNIYRREQAECLGA